MSWWLRSDGGTSVVEFALVAPVLFLLLVGILDLGRAVNAYVTVSNAAREGSHYAALHPTAAPSTIASAVRDRVVPLDPAQVTVTSAYYNGASFTSSPWPPPAGNPPSALPMRVTVTYPWSAATFIGQFFPGGTGATFQASSVSDALR